MLVLALHSAYVAALVNGWLGNRELMLLALAAYCSYVVNAAQFLIKLRTARREQFEHHRAIGLPVGAVK
jgi:3-vinyl bacteriochlorophyllide hydratase